MTDEQSHPADGEKSEDEAKATRIAMGVSLGLAFGVALSLIFDSWALLGVGLALGLAFAAVPSIGKK